ncbi:hypothetical protein [Polyangium mundeleinium]|uniref:Uncharacterized protein n=1 Tax=Polyangium mundeleinium TaxID=2995306 RepID=A0ABT5F4Z8_9BACT|nr:hypothetical protein [Polyangium mundeleinium]MDC0749164.1 hypothetical protein [Polyangium mundeleinium]
MIRFRQDGHGRAELVERRGRDTRAKLAEHALDAAFVRVHGEWREGEPEAPPGSKLGDRPLVDRLDAEVDPRKRRAARRNPIGAVQGPRLFATAQEDDDALDGRYEFRAALVLFRDRKAEERLILIGPIWHVRGHRCLPFHVEEPPLTVDAHIERSIELAVARGDLGLEHGRGERSLAAEQAAREFVREPLRDVAQDQIDAVVFGGHTRRVPMGWGSVK